MQMFVNALESSFVVERLIDPRIISSVGIATTPLASLPAATVKMSHLHVRQFIHVLLVCCRQDF
jgi:hypothetical protein